MLTLHAGAGGQCLSVKVLSSQLSPAQVGVADRMQPPPPALSPLGFEIAGGSPSPMRTKGSDAEELVLLPVLRTLDSRIIRKDSSPEVTQDPACGLSNQDLVLCEQAHHCAELGHTRRIG